MAVERLDVNPATHRYRKGSSRQLMSPYTGGACAICILHCLNSWYLGQPDTEHSSGRIGKSRQDQAHNLDLEAPSFLKSNNI